VRVVPPASGAAVAFDERKIDAIFADLNQCHSPGAAVGIAIGGRPVYRKGFGLAHLELPVMLSPTMRMRIGSNTKQFTAFAYLLLCEEGKASLEDPVGRHLPELHPVARRVTLRQLMGNTSGLRDAVDIKTQFSGIGSRPVSSADFLAFYRDIDDVSAPPGTAWIYNNGGWVLLSLAIERISGQPLEEVMRARVFEPIGMHDSLLRRWDTDFVPNSATAHDKMTHAGGFERRHYGHDLAGAGAIVSTVDDVLRWLAHIDRPVVGSPDTWRAMRTAQRLTNGVSTDYGFGLFATRYRGVDTLSHGGGWTGANSQMLKVPAFGLDVAVLVNRGDVSSRRLVEKILDACLPGLSETRVPSAPFATGVFQSPTTGRVIQVFAAGEQQMLSIDGLDMPVEREEEGVLYPMGGLYRQAVTLKGDPVHPSSLVLNEAGNVEELLPARAAEEPAAQLISGRYRSDNTMTDAAISAAAGPPRLRTFGRFGSAEFTLEYLAAGIWRARSTLPRPYGGILTFERGAAAFRFSNYPTRALLFRRCADPVG
jgi:D-aminopeptidase